MAEVSVPISRVSRALWESIVYPLFVINNPPSLPFSQLSLLYLAHNLPFLLCSALSTFSSLSFLVIPAFLLSFATFLFQVFILRFAALSLSLLRCALSDNGGIPGLGCKDGSSESWPVTDSPVWCWLLGLCPSAKENGGNPERWSSGESSVKVGGGGWVSV